MIAKAEVRALLANHQQQTALAQPFSDEWHESLRQTLGDVVCRQLGIYAIPKDFLLSVVIPVYNECHTIRQLINKVKAVPIRKEIVLVDDGSRDGTREIIEAVIVEHRDNPDPNNTLIVDFHDRNLGKGAACKTGFSRATGDCVLIQDADLEYDPADYPRLISPIIEGKADVVYGSRFLGNREHRVLYYWHRVGNQLLTALSNAFTNLNLTDMETCYKAFNQSAISTIWPTLKQQRFGIEPELTAKVARRRLRTYEISINYDGRTYEQGKKIGLKDALQAAWCIFRYWWAD